MALAFLTTLLALLLIGAVAGLAFEAAIPVGAAAGAVAFGSFAFFGLLLPLLFLFMIFGIAGALFCARGRGHGHGWRGSRMFDEWHRAAHEHGTAGKGES